MLLSLAPERPKTGEVLYGLRLLAGVLGVDRLGIGERAGSTIETKALSLGVAGL